MKRLVSCFYPTFSLYLKATSVRWLCLSPMNLHGLLQATISFSTGTLEVEIPNALIFSNETNCELSEERSGDHYYSFDPHVYAADAHDAYHNTWFKVICGSSTSTKSSDSSSVSYSERLSRMSLSWSPSCKQCRWCKWSVMRSDLIT